MSLKKYQILGLFFGFFCFQVNALEVYYSDRYFDPTLKGTEEWTSIPAKANPVVLNLGVIQKETASIRVVEMKLKNNESTKRNYRLELPSGLSVSSGETFSLNAAEEKVIQLSFSATRAGKQYGEFKVFQDSSSSPTLRLLIQHEVKE